LLIEEEKGKEKEAVEPIPEEEDSVSEQAYFKTQKVGCTYQEKGSY
jgi:hypothetical protein